MPRTKDADVAVRCTDLSIARRARGAADLRVIDGVSFILPHGASLVVKGATGSGKSSLAAVLSGRGGTGLAAVGGDAEVEGIPVRRGGRSRRVLTYVTGYLPQSAGAGLAARRTVSELIGEPITSRDRRVNSRALDVRVATLLDELMLPLGAAAKYPYELSAGMRQRVAFARALVLEPRVFVADEPFANLDIEVRRAARAALLRRRDDRGMATLIVTNDDEVAAEFDAEVLVLDAGHAVAYGRGPGDLLWTPSAGAFPRRTAT